jgi:hypothetical protein
MVSAKGRVSAAVFIEQAHDAGDPALLVMVRAPCLALIAHFDVPSHEITLQSRHYYIRSI